MSRICPCPHPPGGHIVCEDDQFGMCAYKDGEKVGGCLNIPKTFARIEDVRERNIAVVNWVLSELTHVVRGRDDQITTKELEMLVSAEYRSPAGQVIRFRLPNSVDIDNIQAARAIEM